MSMIIARTAVRIVSKESISREEWVKGILIRIGVWLPGYVLLNVSRINLIAGPSVRLLYNVPFYAIVYFPGVKFMCENSAASTF